MEIDLDYIKCNIDTLKNSKWLLVSSMQKAIRRGLAKEAGDIWEVAKEIDRFHAMYRASIIAIEDIGLGNQELVHDFLSTSLKKSNIFEKGGDNYIKETIIKLANSVKDRTACDITWLSGKLVIDNLDRNFLSELYKNEEKELIERVLAGWLLTGTKKIKHGIIQSQDNESNIDLFLDLSRQLKVDEKTMNVVSSSYGYHKEPHIFAYPLLSLAYKNEEKQKSGIYTTGQSFEKNLETPIFYYHGIPILLSAVDGHTSEGKRVLEKIKHNQEIQGIIKNLNENTQDYLLKHALFKIEGQLVNKRLFYPTAASIYRKSLNFYEDTLLFKDLSGKMETLLPEINNIRENILNYSLKKNNKPRI